MTLNYGPPPKGAASYQRQSFGNWAEYGDEVTTRNKQARRLGRLLADLVNRKKAEGARLEKVCWFDHDPVLRGEPFPCIGWKLTMLVPSK